MPRQQVASTAVFNPYAEQAVLKRFWESEFSNISNMMEGKEVTIPKHSNKVVCLVWALKRECSAGCKRKAQHVRYSQVTNHVISELLTKCRVPETQGRVSSRPEAEVKQEGFPRLIPAPTKSASSCWHATAPAPKVSVATGPDKPAFVQTPKPSHQKLTHTPPLQARGL
jgi:hypothetical protein